MTAASRRVVITGCGFLTPLGREPDLLWRALLDRRCAIAPIQAFDPTGLPCRVAAEIPDFDAKQFIDKKEKELRKALRMMARPIEMALIAARLSMADCGIVRDQLDSTRFGVEFGCGMISTDVDDLADASRKSVGGELPHVSYPKWGEAGIPVIEPLWMLKYLPNMPATHVSIALDAQGPSNSITSSEVSGLLAMCEAFRIIGRDGADFFLTGAADSHMTMLSYVRHSLFRKLTHRNDDPWHALRPYDRDRDGTALGEGGCVFAFEELNHAQRRGARIQAEVVGCGSAFDATGDGTGIARAISAALTEAGVQPSDLDHVNAFGSGDIVGDRWEARGIALVVGDRVPVLAPKSYVGHLGSACGPVELLFSMMALDRGAVPATLNHTNPDPECPIRVHAGEPLPVRTPYVLKVAMTDRGQCAAMIVRKWD